MTPGVLACLLVLQACGREPASTSNGTPSRVDVLDHLPAAEIRPADRPPDAVRVIEADLAGRRSRVLSATVPTRVIVRTRIPGAATFSTALSVDASGGHGEGAGVVFRLGISDGRTYEQLIDESVPASDAGAWRPVTLDLSSYGGWQWSLFYRPSTITWQLVLNTYPLGPGSEALRGLWAAPAIESRP